MVKVVFKLTFVECYKNLTDVFGYHSQRLRTSDVVEIDERAFSFWNNRLVTLKDLLMVATARKNRQLKDYNVDIGYVDDDFNKTVKCSLSEPPLNLREYEVTLAHSPEILEREAMPAMLLMIGTCAWIMADKDPLIQWLGLIACIVRWVLLYRRRSHVMDGLSWADKESPDGTREVTSFEHARPQPTAPLESVD